MTTKASININVDDHITYTLEAFYEDFDYPKDHFDDPETVAYIEKEMQWNIWAWCSISVTATLFGISYSETLHCCSYESRQDFIQEGAYFKDMKADARLNLLEKLKNLGFQVTEE